jgi:hypothetical protein
MKPIASTLALAASVALGVGLIVLLVMHLPVTPSMPGSETVAAQDPTIALPSIATSDLARRVKLGEIKSIEVVDQHAVVTTQDGQSRFIVNISPGTSLPDVLQRFGVTPDELRHLPSHSQESAAA